MGIVIHLEVSKSVTEEEWNRVYEESLELVKSFPLAERGTIYLWKYHTGTVPESSRNGEPVSDETNSASCML